MSEFVVDEIVDNAVDSLLSKSLIELSFSDRNDIQEEIHGVKCCAIPETPELLSKSLNAFQEEIDRIEGDAFSKQVYNIIISCRKEEIKRNDFIRHGRTCNWLVDELDSTISAIETTTMEMIYVYSKNHYAIDDDDFRLRFLRVELFDVPKAVDRFLSYLNLTYEFWGDIVLERPIYIKDLLKDKVQRNYLKKGFHQILPFRDRSGRKVITDLGPYMPYAINDHKFCYRHIKIMFYLHDVATRDCVESQQRGLVNCFEFHDWGEMKIFPISSVRMWRKLIRAIPARYAAIHMCMPDNPFLRYVRSTIFMKVFDGIGMSLRMTTSFGTKMECRYQLKSFGIPTQLYPATPTENVKLSVFNQWMKTRLLLEEMDYEQRRNKQGNDSMDGYKAEGIVECPCFNDVVFRQGTSSIDNPGNVVFRELMLIYSEEKERRKKGESEVIDKDPNAHTLDSEPSFYKTGPSPAVSTSSEVGENEDRAFCDWLIKEIEIRRKGRFLEWNKSLGTWVHLKTDSRKFLFRIRQKISIAIYNFQRRKSTFELLKKERTTAIRNMDDKIEKRSISPNSVELNYQFVTGGRGSMSSDDCNSIICIKSMSNTCKRTKTTPSHPFESNS